jgi:hypothetical protein
MRELLGRGDIGQHAAPCYLIHCMCAFAGEADIDNHGALTICLHAGDNPASVKAGFGLRGGRCSVDSLNQKLSSLLQPSNVNRPSIPAAQELDPSTGSRCDPCDVGFHQLRKSTARANGSDVPSADQVHRSNSVLIVLPSRPPRSAVLGL